MPKTTREQIENRSIVVLSFIFLFRYVTQRDLNLLGNNINISFMRPTIQWLLKNKLIAPFKIQEPFKTTGHFLTSGGLARIPQVLLQYEYRFTPTLYASNLAFHSEGIIEICLLLKRQQPNAAYWLSEWMFRQDKTFGMDGSKEGGLKWKNLAGRWPDGLFVLNKFSRIAIEYEKSSKSYQNWIEIIKGLELSFELKERKGRNTYGVDKTRDYESVLFVFNDKKVFNSYLIRLHNPVVSKNRLSREKEAMDVSFKRYFLTTLEDLRNGYVFRPLPGGGPVSRFNDIGIDGSMILKRLVDSEVLLRVGPGRVRVVVRPAEKWQIIKGIAGGKFKEVLAILEEFSSEKIAVSEMFSFVDSSAVNK